MSVVERKSDGGVTCRLASGCFELVAPYEKAVADPVALGKLVSAFLDGARNGGLGSSGGVCYAGSGGLDGGHSAGARRLGGGGCFGWKQERVEVSESDVAVGGCGACIGVGCGHGVFTGGVGTSDVGGGGGSASRESVASGVTVCAVGEKVSEDGGSGLGVGAVDAVDVVVSASVVRGKNYEKNKAKRERAKVLRARVGGLREVCPSLTGSVRTVDTRTAEEIEAVRTLASRRVVENKVAARMAELKLISLNDKDKTDAVRKLDAARMEQRINEAKAKSQASFKKCDTSLKSLGSTGSAGEFALKQEVKRGKDWEIKCKYAQLQNDYMIKHVPEHVRQVILDMPEPVLEHDAEVFGECPEDYDDEQRMAYDIEMNSRAAGVIY